MIGKDTYKSGAVNWEIEQSKRCGNKIIGIQVNPNQHHRLPSAMRKSEELRRWRLENLKRRLKRRR